MIPWKLWRGLRFAALLSLYACVCVWFFLATWAKTYLEQQLQKPAGPPPAPPPPGPG